MRKYPRGIPTHPRTHTGIQGTARTTGSESVGRGHPSVPVVLDDLHSSTARPTRVGTREEATHDPRSNMLTGSGGSNHRCEPRDAAVLPASSHPSPAASSHGAGSAPLSITPPQLSAVTLTSIATQQRTGANCLSDTPCSTTGTTSETTAQVSPVLATALNDKIVPANYVRLFHNDSPSARSLLHSKSTTPESTKSECRRLRSLN